MSAAEPSTLDERRTLDDRRRGRMTRSACAGPPRASPSSTYPKHDLQPGEVLTAKRRALILAAGGELPRAVRRPPHPCANEYALQRLGPDGELVPAAQEFLAAHPAWLQERAQSYIDGANTRWPEAHNQRATLARMVKQTCSSSARSKYSLHNLVSSLHRQRRRPGGYKTLCARDYLSKPHAAKYFQLNLTLGLIDDMDEAGVDLPPAPPRGADCPICFARVEDKPVWCHAEPCRHFMCADCTDEFLEACGGQTCPLCRECVVDYVEVKRPARLSLAAGAASESTETPDGTLST